MGYDQEGERIPKVLLEDLTSVIDLGLLLAFGVALQLVRKKTLPVYALAHGLGIIYLIATAGHYLEQHLIGMRGVEDLFRPHPSRYRGDTWKAIIAAAASLVALLCRFWHCRADGTDCIVGEMTPVHYACKYFRLQRYIPIFGGSVVFFFLCISTRLNAILGGSVLHPIHGSYAKKVLACPTILSLISIASCFSVWLYVILEEAYSPRFALTQKTHAAPGQIPHSHNSWLFKGRPSGEPWSLQHGPHWSPPSHGQGNLVTPEMHFSEQSTEWPHSFHHLYQGHQHQANRYLHLQSPQAQTMDHGSLNQWPGQTTEPDSNRQGVGGWGVNTPGNAGAQSDNNGGVHGGRGVASAKKGLPYGNSAPNLPDPTSIHITPAAPPLTTSPCQQELKLFWPGKECGIEGGSSPQPQPAGDASTLSSASVASPPSRPAKGKASGTAPPPHLLLSPIESQTKKSAGEEFDDLHSELSSVKAYSHRGRVSMEDGVGWGLAGRGGCTEGFGASMGIFSHHSSSGSENRGFDSDTSSDSNGGSDDDSDSDSYDGSDTDSEGGSRFSTGAETWDRGAFRWRHRGVKRSQVRLTTVSDEDLASGRVKLVSQKPLLPHPAPSLFEKSPNYNDSSNSSTEFRKDGKASNRSTQDPIMVQPPVKMLNVGDTIILGSRHPKQANTIRQAPLAGGGAARGPNNSHDSCDGTSVATAEASGGWRDSEMRQRLHAPVDETRRSRGWDGSPGVVRQSRSKRWASEETLGGHFRAKAE